MPQIIERLKSFAWHSTRHIILTVDPRSFEDGQEAHHYATTAKMIPQLIHNLKRTRGVLVRDWAWYLEWHRNGFPHWHLFIDVVIKGKAGMIGGSILRHYWDIGAVREAYIRNEKHWNKMTGYFEKHGYFEKRKAHQGKLPEWAMKSTKRIRRSDSMRRKSKCENTEHEEKQAEETRSMKRNLNRNYEDIIASCGSKTRIMIKDDRSDAWHLINIPYKRYKSLPGAYVQGEGYVTRLSRSELEIMMTVYQIPSRYSGARYSIH